MENPYQKTFPDLMSERKIMYVLYRGVSQFTLLPVYVETTAEHKQAYASMPCVVVQKMDAYKICFIPVFNRGVA